MKLILRKFGILRSWIDITDYFVDTNILWWYLVANSKNHKITKIYFDKLIKIPDNEFFINEFIIIELSHLLIKKVGEKGFNIAKNLLKSKFPFFKISFDIINQGDLENTLNFLYKYGLKTSIGGRDSTILHSMNLHNINNIITNDKAFYFIENIIVHNPFSNNLKNQM
ncbi:MAG: PIN domain-containing protein [Candidatus Lokiarchaeota archaeon]|nr:PIN domain-containing protein [Candidatus Harpocratesius repetitus]